MICLIISTNKGNYIISYIAGRPERPGPPQYFRQVGAYGQMATSLGSELEEEEYVEGHGEYEADGQTTGRSGIRVSREEAVSEELVCHGTQKTDRTRV